MRLGQNRSCFVELKSLLNVNNVKYYINTIVEHQSIKEKNLLARLLRQLLLLILLLVLQRVSRLTILFILVVPGCEGRLLPPVVED